jgi:hypothetical protein
MTPGQCEPKSPARNGDGGERLLVNVAKAAVPEYTRGHGIVLLAGVSDLELVFAQPWIA